MEKIEHSQLDVNGLSLHVAHVGKGIRCWPSPKLAFRRSPLMSVGMASLINSLELENSRWEDLVEDLLAILDYFSISKAFIIGKDFGSRTAYEFAIVHPDRVLGVATVGMPFTPGATNVGSLPEGFYVSRFREPGRAEKDFSRFDVETVVKKIYTLFCSSELQVANEGQEIMDLVDPSAPLPPWFSKEDLACYATSYGKSGFQFPLQMPYRTIHKLTEISNPRVQGPAMLIMGEKDYILKFPGMEDYIKSGMVRHFVPDLEVAFIPEGTHFVQEQFPEEVNKLIIAFLNNHI